MMSSACGVLFAGLLRSSAWGPVFVWTGAVFVVGVPPEVVGWEAQPPPSVFDYSVSFDEQEWEAEWI